MSRRVFVGIDIQPGGLYLAALQRNRPHTRLVGLRFESLEGVLDVSTRQPNIRDARRFIDGLRRGVDALANGEERIALSLPDRAGRIYLTDVDAPFKTHQEGIDVLKWQLKTSLPAPPAQTRLDYQVLDKRDDGRQHCIVAAIAKPVLEQYEDLVNEAGRHAVQIDFHSLSIYNYYRPRLDLGEEFILVGLERGLLSIQYVLGHGLCYQRVSVLKADPQRIFREINRTLVEAYKSFPAMKRCAVLAHVDPDMEGEIDNLLSAAFEREVKFLDPALKRFDGAVRTGGLQPVGSVVAALGAAERMM
jgi:type IV pilus assembly protein PilM